MKRMFIWMKCTLKHKEKCLAFPYQSEFHFYNDLITSPPPHMLYGLYRPVSALPKWPSLSLPQPNRSRLGQPRIRPWFLPQWRCREEIWRAAWRVISGSAAAFLWAETGNPESPLLCLRRSTSFLVKLKDAVRNREKLSPLNDIIS